MTYEELKIQLDLNEPIDVLKFVEKKTKDKDWFVVCDDGDCHLFDNDGNEIDVKKIKSLDEWLIPKYIKKIVVPDSVKNIKVNAFTNCINLISISIPDSVESIESYAFYACESLASINIPDSTKYIGGAVFTFCENLTSIVISDSVEYIGFRTFFFCKNLKSLTFKGKTIDQVKSMEYYPFGLEDESIIKCIK